MVPNGSKQAVLESPISWTTSLLRSKASFCSNSEGWGPFAEVGSHFTLCFVESLVVGLSVGMIFLGSLNLFFLSRKETAPTKKNWHYWMKIIGVIAVIGSTVARTVLQTTSSEQWSSDISFYARVLSTVALCIALAIHLSEHAKSKVPSGVLLFFWLFYIILSGIKLQTLIETKVYNIRLPGFIVFCCTYALACLVFFLEWLVKKERPDYTKLGIDEEDEDVCPVEEANVFSVLSFNWITPMMKYGYKTYLTEDDLWNLRKQDSAKACSGEFEVAWQKQLESDKPKLWIALFAAFSRPFFIGTVFKTIHDCLSFTQPQLLRLLITFIQSYSTDQPDKPTRGVLIAFAMFLCSVTQTGMLHQYFQRTFETGMRVRSGLSAAVYKKAMVLSNEGRAAKSTGDIVNLMAVDTTRLDQVAQYGQNIWSAPFQIIICMISLYNLVGLSMFAGIGFMIVMIPVNWTIARIMKRLQVRQMKNKDSRTRLLTEIINSMKSIKLYAWGAPFMSKLQEVRGRELATLRKIGITQAFSNFTWSTTPFLVSCLTFAVFALTQDRPLTTEIVFPALTLFNLLSFPLAMLPMVISMLVEATVALDRLTSMLTAEEIQKDAVIFEPPAISSGDVSVKIESGRFSWNRDWTNEKDALKDISFEVTKGELSCIVGRVGSGKSSLLQAILGDLWRRKGTVRVRGSLAYVAQSPWIMNATVKENILFGHRYDHDFYQRTLEACALKEDLEVLPDRDETEVGEKGISLSGGQKARLTLARAVYARADVYLLDDPLSAVDQHVGRHLIDNVLGPNGLLAGKTKIMATNSIPVLVVADYITLLKDGVITESGTYDEAMTAKKEIRVLIKLINENNSDDNTSSSEGSSSPVHGTTSTEVSEDEDEQLDQAAILPKIKKPRRPSNKSLRRASMVSISNQRSKGKSDEENLKKTQQLKERSEQGKVSWDVYTKYAKAANIVAVLFYLVFLLASQSAQIGASVWLKKWAEYNDTHPKDSGVYKWIGIYFAIGIGSSLLIISQTMILYIFCSIEAARKMHEWMAFAIFRSPMSFFETTPAGRILNRFSGDVYKIDEVLARSFNQFFANIARCSFTLVVISVGTPAFIGLIVPLGLIYLYVQRYYLYTSRELKRLDSVSRSPIYAHFQESLGGISTIRAYKQEQRFEYGNQARIDGNLRAYFPSITANRWLAIRLEFMGSIIIFGAAIAAVISVASGSGLSAGMVGLSMSYALQITQALNWLVRQSVEVETNIVSVERVLEYSRLPPEAPETIPRHRPSVGWPANGAVAFKNYSTRYREGLDLILKDISLSINPQEKIGIVGRTGAGKSSLTLAMFRIIEPASGHIEIDSVNTSTIGLLDLRKRLAIIPQDAMIYSGTVRENLDPSGVHDDTELWSVLEHSHLRDHIQKMDGKLDAIIHEGGSNLSSGERQLMCLARALLTPSNILVLDEATAAVDVQTDTLIQQTIRSEFKNRTIITIAHRINTIMDSDRIVVLQAGRVAEFDTPKALLEKGSASLFYSLVKEAGLLQEASNSDGLVDVSGAGAVVDSGSGK